MAFTDELAKAAELIRESQRRHPFVRGLIDGSLEADHFKRWVVQHYLYLKEYARMLASAAAKAGTRQSMALFSRALGLVLDEGLQLHCACAESFGIPELELERQEMWPTTRAYADFMVRTASLGDIPELLAVALPQADGYTELGFSLATSHGNDRGTYADWIGCYVSPQFVEVADQFGAELDSIVAAAPKEIRRELTRLYLVASRYEWQFWDMCWTGEQWRP